MTPDEYRERLEDIANLLEEEEISDEEAKAQRKALREQGVDAQFYLTANELASFEVNKVLRDASQELDNNDDCGDARGVILVTVHFIPPAIGEVRVDAGEMYPIEATAAE
jgi:hypothetical protein